jgi:hypothetical protein
MQWYTKDASGKLTIYSDQDAAQRAARNFGCAGWGSLVMTPSALPPERESKDSPGCGTSCPCRACQMKYHGGW